LSPDGERRQVTVDGDMVSLDHAMHQWELVVVE
jgi:hypothetical protein